MHVASPNDETEQAFILRVGMQRSQTFNSSADVSSSSSLWSRKRQQSGASSTVAASGLMTRSMTDFFSGRKKKGNSNSNSKHAANANAAGGGLKSNSLADFNHDYDASSTIFEECDDVTAAEGHVARQSADVAPCGSNSNSLSSHDQHLSSSVQTLSGAQRTSSEQRLSKLRAGLSQSASVKGGGGQVPKRWDDFFHDRQRVRRHQSIAAPGRQQVSQQHIFSHCAQASAGHAVNHIVHVSFKHPGVSGSASHGHVATGRHRVLCSAC